MNSEMNQKRILKLLVWSFLLGSLIQSASLQEIVPINLLGGPENENYMKSDEQYNYLNSYVDNCLNQLKNCTGVTIIVNVTVIYDAVDDLTVSNDLESQDTSIDHVRKIILSYGGESPYSPVGFYLSQFNNHGDKYVEFGFSVLKNLYSQRLYLIENSPTTLSFSFDYSTNKLIVYVDGSYYTEVSSPLVRPYYSLGVNYNPYRWVKSLKPSAEGEKPHTTIHSASFVGTALDPNNELIKSVSSNYLIGCIDQTLLGSIETLSLTSDETLTDKCKERCLISDPPDQIYILKENNCACISDYRSYKPTDFVDCSTLTPETSYTAYWATHIISNLTVLEKLGLELNIKTLRDPIEPGDPILFDITLTQTNSCRVYINFDDGMETSVIGSTSVVHEYLEAGTSNVNITAVSLKDPQKSESFFSEIRVKKPIDRQDMNEVKLHVTVVDEKSILISAIVTGGAPHSCEVSYGDSPRKEAYDSEVRMSSFNMTHDYNNTGIYNVSIVCTKSSTVKSSQVSNWALVYLPNTTLSALHYQLTDNRYNLFNLRYLYVPVASNPESTFDLELPFSSVSVNLKFTVADLKNTSNSFEWVNSKRTSLLGPNGGYIVKMKAKYLRSMTENYFVVSVNSIHLATFIINQEEIITQAPELAITNDKYLINKPAFFSVAFKPHANSMLKVEYGDNTPAEVYQILDQEEVDPEPITLELNHTYTTSQVYTIKVTMANHLSTIETKLEATFEPGLPEFKLTFDSNKADLSEPVKFVISPVTHNNTPILAPSVKLIFDNSYQDEEVVGDHLTKMFTNYTFDSSNNFELVVVHNYDGFGLFTAMVNVSNSVSFQTSSVNVKIGKNLNKITGVVLNSYANANQYVTFYLDIQGGNGYDVNVNVNDVQVPIVVLPWSYINSRGQITSDFINANPAVFNENTASATNLPKAEFANGVINFMYSYKQAGVYETSFSAVNPFGSLKHKFCSKIMITNETSTEAKALETAEGTCALATPNLKLEINKQVLGKAAFSLSKGLLNEFEVKYTSCIPTETQANLTSWGTYWTLNNVKKINGIEHLESFDQYCSVEGLDSKFVLQPNELPFGKYDLRAIVFKRDQQEIYAQLAGYQIEVVQSKLNVTLVGAGRTTELNWDEVLNLKFYEGSFDPDAGDSTVKTGLRFSFVCMQNSSFALQQSVMQQAENGDFDFEKSQLNIAFQDQESNITFYEKNCIIKNESNPMPIRMDPVTKTIQINATNINLNNTEIIPLRLQLFVNKGSRYSMAQMMVTINISSLITIVPSSDLDKMDEQMDALNDIAKTDPKKAIVILNTFVNVINSDAPAQPTNETRNATADAEKLTNIRGKMLNTVDTIVDRIDDPKSVLMVVDATGSVSSNPNQMPTNNQEKGSYIFEKVGEKAKNFSSEDGAMVVDLTASILGAGSNLFDAAVNTLPIMEANRSNMSVFLEPVNETVVEEVIVPVKYSAPTKYYEQEETGDFPEDLFEADEIVKIIETEKKEAVIAQTAEIAKRTFNGISNVGGALASTGQVANGSVTTISQKNMALVVSSQPMNASNDSSSTFSSDTGGGIKIVMPSFGKVLNDTAAPTSISTKMLVSGKNPFQSKSPGNSVTGTIVSMTLTDENGNELVVNNTQEPIIINVPTNGDPTLYKGVVSQLGFAYHKTKLLTNASSLSVVLIPDCPEEYYHVYIKYTNKSYLEEYPDEKNHDWVFTSPNNMTLEEGDSEELRYTAFLSNTDTKGNGTYYIGIKLAKLCPSRLKEIHANYSANLTNATNTGIMSNYSIRIFTTSCKYWDETEKAWSTAGCNVGPKTTFNMTQCYCYHLTTFGTDFYVPPNTIDFSTVFAKFKNLSENAAVFATVITILGLYVIAAILSRHMDKKDLIKWGAIPLSDNLPTDTYYYVISVQTGVGKECGTTSKVGFVLAGEYSDSGVRKLSDDKRRGFKSGSVCNFVLSVEEPLGPLTYLRIWHDNSGHGRNKSWYLSVVDVLDLQTNEKSEFICHDWFAVEKGDGQIDRVIPVACQKELSSYKHLFNQSIKKKFTDGHLWFSVFSRPTKSSFTRLQRISCCMSLLFCTMIANAMFYRAEGSAEGNSTIIIGPIRFSMTQIYTSFISTLIVVPVNLIIVTLFRKAAIKHSGVPPQKNKHVAKRQYWRKINFGTRNKPESNTENVQSIELPEFEADRIKEMYQNDSYYDMSNPNGPKKPKKQSALNANGDNEYRRGEDDAERNKKLGRSLPHWVIYIAWFLVIASILVPAFFVILYSMQWGRERSNAWLTSMAFSFFQSLFIIDPIKVFIITGIIILILRKLDDDGESLIDSGDPLYNAILNKDEEFLHKSTASLSQIDIREIMNARHAKLSRLEPIPAEVLEAQRQNRLKRVRMNQVLIEGASYFFFLIVLLFLCHQSRSRNTNLMHRDMTNLFLENPVMNFADIKSRDDFWKYMDAVFIPQLYAPTWYNNKTLTWREKITIGSRASIRVGAPRIRQLRIKENTCRVNPRVQHIIGHCRADYNWIDDDTKDYDIGWNGKNLKKVEGDATMTTTPVTTTTTRPPLKPSKYKCNTAWCYQNTVQTKSAPIIGLFATYKGGGYAVSLARSIEKSVKTLADLKEQGWVDELTRAVFLEFTIFNPNVNLFASATLIVEYLSTGSAVTYQSMGAFRLYNYVGSTGIVVLIFEIVFVLFFLYFTVHEVLEIKKQKFSYFKQFWNLNELIIVTFSLVAMIMFALRTVFTNAAIKIVQETELGEFVNFNTIAMWDELFNSISAIITFCSTLKFLKLLRFNKRIGMLSATLKYASSDIASFSLTFGIIMFAFAQFAYLIFGPLLNSYRNFLTSIESLFLMMLGQFKLNDYLAANLALGAFFFITFIIVVAIGLVSMFITILNEAFAKVKKDIASTKDDSELVDFIVGTIKNLGKRHKKNKALSSGSATSFDNKSEIVSQDGDEAMRVTLKEEYDYYGSNKAPKKPYQHDNESLNDSMGYY